MKLHVEHAVMFLKHARADLHNKYQCLLHGDVFRELGVETNDSVSVPARQPCILYASTDSLRTLMRLDTIALIHVFTFYV